MRIWRDADIDLELMEGTSVAVIGYGNQGRAQALNLRDGGWDVRVGLRGDSAGRDAAATDDLPAHGPVEAARVADVVALLVPDEAVADAYRAIEPVLKPGAALVIAHGLAVRFGLLRPRPDLDLVMVAPKGPGGALRSLFTKGGGLPALWAVAQDATGRAQAMALAYGRAIGCARAGLLQTTIADECEADLFNEAAVVWGGVPALLIAGWEALVEAGVPPELAHMECVGELRLLADLIDAKGFAGMRAATSTAAQFMAAAGGTEVIDDGVRDRMRALLTRVRSGEIARVFLEDATAGGPRIRAAREALAAHPIEAARVALAELKP